MAYVVRGLWAGMAAVLAAGPALGFDLIAGPASPLEGASRPGLATAYAPTATQDYDAGGLFHEFRIGWSGLGGDGADGVAVGGTVLLDPLLLRFESAFASETLSPRPHFGLAVSPGGAATELQAGFTWDMQIADLFFIEASSGGGVHVGQLDLEEADADRALGCRFNFRNSAGAGIGIGDRLQLVASVGHATDAGLCGSSGGLMHAGAAIGYKF